MEDKKVMEIPIENIVPNPYQPRKVFNEEALVDLANSIKEHGVIQPIIVRNVNGKYEIIAGESFSLDLAPIFSDADGDELSFSVKINGEDAVSADANFTFTPALGGTYELEFFASDFKIMNLLKKKLTKQRAFYPIQCLKVGIFLVKIS